MEYSVVTDVDTEVDLGGNIKVQLLFFHWVKKRKGRDPNGVGEGGGGRGGALHIMG